MNAKPVKPSVPEKSWRRRILLGSLPLVLISTLLLVRRSTEKNGETETPKQEEESAIRRTDTQRKDDPSSIEDSASLRPLEGRPRIKDDGAQQASPLLEPVRAEALKAPSPGLKAGPDGFSEAQQETIEWVLVSRGLFKAEIHSFPGSGFTEVNLNYDYYIARQEVTIGQFKSLMPNIPLSPFIKGLRENAPVTHLSWEDAVAFCARLSELNREIPEGYVYRLPTEAEWEYACRMLSEPPDRSAEDEGSSSGAIAVGTTAGLSGMRENPSEWCLDLLKLETNAVVDPVGRIEGPYYSLRGVPEKGSEWIDCSTRHVVYSNRGIRDVSFRPVLAPHVNRLSPVNRK